MNNFLEKDEIVHLTHVPIKILNCTIPNAKITITNGAIKIYAGTAFNYDADNDGYCDSVILNCLYECNFAPQYIQTGIGYWRDCFIIKNKKEAIEKMGDDFGEVDGMLFDLQSSQIIKQYEKAKTIYLLKTKWNCFINKLMFVGDSNDIPITKNYNNSPYRVLPEENKNNNEQSLTPYYIFGAYSVCPFCGHVVLSNRFRICCSKENRFSKLTLLGKQTCGYNAYTHYHMHCYYCDADWLSTAILSYKNNECIQTVME